MRTQIAFLLLSFTGTVKAATVRVTESCVTRHEDIEVLFDVDLPTSGDKIGITFATSNKIIMSAPTCEASSCLSSPPKMGIVSLSAELTAGRRYKAVLAQADDVVVANSTVFLVASKKCHDEAQSRILQRTPRPTRRPTQNPTKRPTRPPTQKPTRRLRPTRLPTTSPTSKPTRLPTTSPTSKPTSSPTSSPSSNSVPGTPQPSANPTTTPTAKPTKTPTSKPTITPTSISGNPANAAAKATLDAAQAAIITILQNDNRKAPQFLRMCFHDCVGGCDGCIDLTSNDNRGLEPPIDALAPVVAQFSTNGVTRGDIWMLACMTAVDRIKGPSNPVVSFQMNWFGRQNCEDVSQTNCVDAGTGASVTCGPKSGPPRALPSIHFNGQQTRDFFFQNFGFTERETTAILGAHNLGILSHDNSGIDGAIGWVPDNSVFQNSYYQELVGSVSSATSTFEEIIAGSVEMRSLDDALATPVPMPPRHYWGRFLPSGPHTIMLHPDISLVRDLDIDPTTGVANNCGFTGSTACPIASTFQHAFDFASDNTVFLNAFNAVMGKMTTNGYVAVPCADAACPLTPSPSP